MLKKITDNLFYFDMPSKVMLYIEKDQGILIDSGLDARTAKKVQKELQNLNVTPVALIVTHAHVDHFGGAATLKAFYPGLEVMASKLDGVFLTHPELEPYIFYGAEPISDLQNKFLLGEAVEVNRFVIPGEKLHLLDSEWEILDLSGHSVGQIGLIAPGRAVLTADALFPAAVVGKYKPIYHFDLGGAVKTIKKLEELALTGEFSWFVPGHGENYPSLQHVIISNLQAINETVEAVQAKIKEPHTREEVVALLYDEFAINAAVSQYFLTFSAISAVLSYLEKSGTAEAKVLEGKFVFTSK